MTDQLDPSLPQEAVVDAEPAPVGAEEQVSQVVGECRRAEKLPFAENLNLKAERSEYFYDIAQGEMVNAVHSSLIILRGTQSNSSIAKINATHSVIVLCDIAEIKEIHGAKNVVILVNSNISKSTLAQSDVRVIEQ